MAGLIVDIYSDDEKVEKMLKELVNHNETEFKKAGFRTEYFREKFGYSLVVVPLTMTATLGFSIGKRLMMRGLKAELKKIDSNIRVEERKKSKVNDFDSKEERKKNGS
jgi:hypothetical protein